MNLHCLFFHIIFEKTESKTRQKGATEKLQKTLFFKIKLGDTFDGNLAQMNTIATESMFRRWRGRVFEKPALRIGNSCRCYLAPAAS